MSKSKKKFWEIFEKIMTFGNFYVYIGSEFTFYDRTRR